MILYNRLGNIAEVAVINNKDTLIIIFYGV